MTLFVISDLTKRAPCLTRGDSNLFKFVKVI